MNKDNTTKRRKNSTIHLCAVNKSLDVKKLKVFAEQ